jgi:streptogramin lyase
MWFTNSESIGRITTTGTVTSYYVGMYNFPGGITAGPDGALWFTVQRAHAIGRITTTGTITEYWDDSIFYPFQITAGPDGALWFTNTTYPNTPSIGRITTTGTVTTYTDPSVSGGSGIAAGPDGALWFTNYENNSIGRITTTVTPGIVDFTPTVGRVGTRVTITGQNLGRATKVTFNGTPAKAILSNSATEIVTIVPHGATTGRISITTEAGTATSTTTFTYVPPR